MTRQHAKMRVLSGVENLSAFPVAQTSWHQDNEINVPILLILASTDQMHPGGMERNAANLVNG
jgi:hypothetical protein